MPLGRLVHEVGDEVADFGVLADQLAHHHEAAGREPLADPAGHRGRPVRLAVGDAVHDRVEQHGDGLREVDQPLGVLVVEDRIGLPHVRVDDGGALVLLEQRPAVDEDHRVVVDVDHVRGGVDALGHLVDVVLGGQA